MIDEMMMFTLDTKTSRSFKQKKQQHPGRIVAIKRHVSFASENELFEYDSDSSVRGEQDSISTLPTMTSPLADTIKAMSQYSNPKTNHRISGQETATHFDSYQDADAQLRPVGMQASISIAGKNFMTSYLRA